MAKNKKGDFCFREVEFYKEGYISVAFWRAKNGSEQLFHPMTTVYRDLKELGMELKMLKKDFKKQKNDPVDIYGALAIKIKFNRTSPLKKEFWETESDMKLDNMYRIKQYLIMLENFGKLYQIMVMPYHFNVKKKEWILTNWLPVLLTITDEELGKIAIMSSGTQVDISAKSMALYTIEWIKGFDIINEELIEKPDKIDSEEVNC